MDNSYNIAVYRFIKKISTPFNKWRAFKHGIIDAEGNILKTQSELKSRNEKDSFTKFDLLVLNIKKTLDKLPGGTSRINSYNAALYLIKEHEDIFLGNDIPDEILSEIAQEINEETIYLLDEDVPVNNVSSGAIAGMDGSSLPLKVQKTTILRHIKQAKKRKPLDEPK